MFAWKFDNIQETHFWHGTTRSRHLRQNLGCFASQSRVNIRQQGDWHYKTETCQNIQDKCVYNYIGSRMNILATFTHVCLQASWDLHRARCLTQLMLACGYNPGFAGTCLDACMHVQRFGNTSSSVEEHAWQAVNTGASLVVAANPIHQAEIYFCSSCDSIVSPSLGLQFDSCQSTPFISSVMASFCKESRVPCKQNDLPEQNACWTCHTWARAFLCLCCAYWPLTGNGKYHNPPLCNRHFVLQLLQQVSTVTWPCDVQWESSSCRLCSEREKENTQSCFAQVCTTSYCAFFKQQSL